ncbi:hypothetical protein Lesp02_57880 [Lentzea sp. NBRC 105346]|nr:hypothetical protein Lesp02_57880 [Lentzea sp. NBRC 105346]
MNFYGTPPEAPPEQHTDHWIRMVAESAVWQHVRDSHRPDRMRALAIKIAHGLARLRDEVEPADDPWRDDDLVRRFGVRIAWLVGECRPGLYPVEALLLALAPLLHQALWSRAVAEHRRVGPTDFELTGTTDEPRASYELFLRDHGDLIKRAGLPKLPERDNAAEEIGWWLFHRWLRQRMEVLQEKSIAALLADVCDEEALTVVRPSNVRELLKGLREAPQGIATPARVADADAVLPMFGGTPDKELLRRPMVLVLARAAHLAAVEVTDLSRDLVWHMGIPRPARVDSLLDTVRKATWPGLADGVVLNAECEHEAVVEVLREHAKRLGELLRSTRLVTAFPSVEPLAGLPAWASGDQVVPCRDEEGKPKFSGWSKFRLDEERVRDLLMGEQLYQDRHMAIRELYQNALDACRYRQARELYRQRRWNLPPSGWAGEIAFRQDVDEHGRHYLDCVDNGIGMGEDELKGVFAQAGVRFADLTEFREERLDWRGVDPPVELYPNSRFGIGVLSYFMLADEIEVKTRRMGRDGKAHGPQLRVTISGPGHLFQIQEIDESPEPGTSVRLYLKEPDPQGTVISWLEKLLGIADFHTTATHAGDEPMEWQPGVLRPKRGNRYTTELDAGGEVIQPDNVPVAWCEHGGALLVDGLLTSPGVQRGVVQQSLSYGPMRGVVVNLTGTVAPRLSVDRSRTLGDVSDSVERLVTAALPALLAGGDALLDLDWLTEVAGGSPMLGDLVTKALIEDGTVVRGFRCSVDVGAVGWMAEDAEIVNDRAAPFFPPGRDARTYTPRPADHILLWRLLAHAPNERLALVRAAAPGIDFPDRPMLPAVPTDGSYLLRAAPYSVVEDGGMTQHDVRDAANESDLGIRTVARRAAELNLLGCSSHVFDTYRLPQSDRILLSVDLNGEPPWLEHEEPVPYSHFLNALLRQGRPVADTARWLASRGFDAHAAQPLLNVELDSIDLQLLRDGRGFLDPENVPLVGQVVSKAILLGIPVEEVSRRLTCLGFDTALLRWPDDVGSEDLQLLTNGRVRPGWLADRAAAWQIAESAERLGRSPSEVGERLVAFGIRVPVHLPERVCAGDGELLRQVSPDFDHLASIGVLIFTGQQLGISVGDVIDRVAQYGVRPKTDDVPVVLGTNDAFLLSNGLDGTSPWLPVGDIVPVVHLIEAYAKFGITPARAKERLEAFGYEVEDLPPGEAVALVEPGMLTHCEIDPREPVSLGELLKVSETFHLPVLEVAKRFRNIGLKVPDVRESIKAAIAKLPRRV